MYHARIEAIRHRQDQICRRYARLIGAAVGLMLLLVFLDEYWTVAAVHVVGGLLGLYFAHDHHYTRQIAAVERERCLARRTATRQTTIPTLPY